MGKLNGKKLFVWSYERGTLQYDIICGLILAFIFLVPKGCFVSKGDPAAGKAAKAGVESQKRAAGSAQGR